MQAPAFSWFKVAHDPDHTWILAAINDIFNLVKGSSTEAAFENGLANAVILEWEKRMSDWTANGMKVDDLKTFLQAVSAYMVTRDAAINAARQKLASGLTF
jgi:hypothetical protein